MSIEQEFPPPMVLAFAASDPTGGAGIQADLLTVASLGCHPLSVITALTVQDTAGVDAVMAVDASWVADQARALLEDMPVAAFKLGLLGSVEVIAAIAEIVSDYPDVPLVFDPVLAETLLRVVQEALTNTARHGAASRLKVDVATQGDDLRLTIEDDGRLRGELREGNGLTGMRERVEERGGTLLFSRGAQGALRIEAVLPA